MDPPLDLSDLDPEVLEEPAKHLEPNDIKRLGELLSSEGHILGPCWDAVASELGFSPEERQAIHDKATRLKVAEGQVVLKGWALSGDTACRTLFVLQSALQKCERPDVMARFVEAVHNMNRVTMHVVVKFPPDLQDNQNRLQRLSQETDSSTTLEQLLANKLSGEITDYEITAPKWAEWQTSAGALKGNMVTITRLSPHETRRKNFWEPRQETIMDAEVSSSTSNVRDIFNAPNIPHSCRKKLNNHNAMLSLSDNEEDEEEIYIPMAGPNFSEIMDIENQSVMSDSSTGRLSSAASFCNSSSELQFPQDTYRGTALVRPHNNRTQSRLDHPLPSPAFLLNMPPPFFPPDGREPVAPPPCVGLSASAPALLARGMRMDIGQRFPEENPYDDFREGPPVNASGGFQNACSPSDHGSPVMRYFQDSMDSMDYLTPMSSRSPSQHRLSEEMGAVGGDPELPAISSTTPLGKKLRPLKFIPQAAKELATAMVDGWHGSINMEQLRVLMSPHMEENGYFVVWRSRDPDELIVSISHCGAVLHYNIRARAIGKEVYYYLFKSLYRDTSVLNLLAYYKTHPLESKINPVTGANIPVTLRRAVKA